MGEGDQRNQSKVTRSSYHPYFRKMGRGVIETEFHCEKAQGFNPINYAEHKLLPTFRSCPIDHRDLADKTLPDSMCNWFTLTIVKRKDSSSGSSRDRRNSKVALNPQGEWSTVNQRRQDFAPGDQANHDSRFTVFPPPSELSMFHSGLHCCTSPDGRMISGPQEHYPPYRPIPLTSLPAGPGHMRSSAPTDGHPGRSWPSGARWPAPDSDPGEENDSGNR